MKFSTNCLPSQRETVQSRIVGQYDSRNVKRVPRLPKQKQLVKTAYLKCLQERDSGQYLTKTSSIAATIYNIRIVIRRKSEHCVTRFFRILESIFKLQN